MSWGAWDVAGQFSILNGNPNGAWSYGIKSPSDLSGPLALFPHTGSSTAFDYWVNEQNLTLGTPTVARNISSSSVSGIGPGEATMHPGPSNEIATTRWTAPSPGLYRIFGKFGAGDIGAVDAFISSPGEPLWSRYAVVDDQIFDFTRALEAGAGVDFMVGNAGSFFYDSTPIHATIAGPLNPIRIQLTLGDWVGGDPVQPFTVSLYQDASLVEVMVAVAITGGLSLTTARTGTYTIRVRGSHWVQKSLGPVNLTPAGVELTANLTNGDADGSGEVDAADIDLVISGFGGTVGAPGYLVNADLDGSGEVDAADIDIAIARFGSVDE